MWLLSGDGPSKSDVINVLAARIIKFLTSLALSIHQQISHPSEILGYGRLKYFRQHHGIRHLPLSLASNLKLHFLRFEIGLGR